MGEIIDYLRQKIKVFCSKTLYLVYIYTLILTILNGFLFGVQYVYKNTKFTPYIVKQADLVHKLSVDGTKTADLSVESENLYVASKNGIRYYFKWCSGVGRIKEGNLVSFETAEMAKEAGFTPAKNCPGL